jgi:hypothetical protein
VGLPPNFPSFFPLVYHNINQEIPQKYSNLVRLSLAAAKSFFYSTFCTVLAQFFSDQIDSDLIFRWREMVLSTFVLLLCPLSLLYGQYWPLYRSIRDETIGRSLVPFQVVCVFVMAFVLAGVPGSGMIGVGYAIVAFRSGETVNKVAATVLTFWQFANTILQLIVLFLVLPLGSGGGEMAGQADIAF